MPPASDDASLGGQHESPAASQDPVDATVEAERREKTGSRRGSVQKRRSVRKQPSGVWDAIIETLTHSQLQREQVAKHERDLRARVHGMLLMLDLRVDVQELDGLIREVEALDMNAKELIEAAKAKLERAIVLQEKRRAVELKRERERVHDELVAFLKEQLNLEPEEIDCPALRERLELADSMSLSTSGSLLYERASELLLTAERVQNELRAARRRQAEGELRMQLTSPVCANLLLLEPAAERARALGGAQDILTEANKLEKAVRRRNESLARLEKLLSSSAEEVAHSKLLEAIMEATECHAPMHTVTRASILLMHAERAQRTHELHAELISQILASPREVSEVDVEELRRARDNLNQSEAALLATGSHAVTEMLKRSDSLLSAAEAAREATARELSKLLVQAQPLASDNKGLSAAKSALKSAEKDGQLGTDLLELVRERIHDAEEAANRGGRMTSLTITQRAADFGTKRNLLVGQVTVRLVEELAVVQKKRGTEATKVDKLLYLLESEGEEASRLERELLREERSWQQLVLSGIADDGGIDERLNILLAEGKQQALQDLRTQAQQARDKLHVTQQALGHSRRRLCSSIAHEQRVSKAVQRARWEAEWTGKLAHLAQQLLGPRGPPPPSPPFSAPTSPRMSDRRPRSSLWCCGGKRAADDVVKPAEPAKAEARRVSKAEAISQAQPAPKAKPPSDEEPRVPGEMGEAAMVPVATNVVKGKGPTAEPGVVKETATNGSVALGMPTHGDGTETTGSSLATDTAFIDLFNWLPLMLDAAHIPALLLDLAPLGAYATSSVSHAVAAACCSLDCAVASRFLLELATGFVQSSNTAKEVHAVHATSDRSRRRRMPVDQLSSILRVWLSEMVFGSDQAQTLALTLEQIMHLYDEVVAIDYVPTLTALFQLHFLKQRQTASEGHRALPFVMRSIHLILASAIRSRDRLANIMRLCVDGPKDTSPAHTLDAAAAELAHHLEENELGYLERRRDDQMVWEDLMLERAILAFVALFIEHSNSLIGFQHLVPRVFDIYLARATPLRSEMCRVLEAGGMERSVALRVGEDDELVRHRFFWSSVGLALFSHPELLDDPVKLKRMVDEAVREQPVIVVSFLQEACDKAAVDDQSEATLGVIIETSLKVLLEHAEAVGLGLFGQEMVAATERILDASTRHFSRVFAGALRSWKSSSLSEKVLEDFCADFKPRLSGDAPRSRAESERDEYIIQALAKLFIADPERFPAFSKLVPDVFRTHLKLGSDSRLRLNSLLMAHAFEPTLEDLIANSDEFVTSPYFWNSKVMPLFTIVVTKRDYPKLHKTSLTDPEGSVKQLYPKLLALLLRIASRGSADPEEIARRTKEVLDQFERNEDQQRFLLTIFDTLEERSRTHPELFHDLQLTLLSDVAQNGVQTISSVSGEGMQLCEQAMTTLLQTYIKERSPQEWKFLFKEAANISFMVKYMFREDLKLAKQKLRESVMRKGEYSHFQKSSEVQSMMTDLVDQTLDLYGDVGLYDPADLAKIDFINQPEKMVALVNESQDRRSRKGKSGMNLMTEITAAWMEHMVEKGFPPLSPHHTQAFIVLMAARFFELHLQLKQEPSHKGLHFHTFIAQMATGEGKSIVIAMLAIFMVKTYGIKVHVLENNAGLLERDFITNKPFYDKFGINCAQKLDEPGVQICYCLKAAINTRFLRKMVEGTLDTELGNTVLIVDEVDDLIINEWPNAHYVRKDDEQTPALAKCYSALKRGNERPSGVPQEVWDEAAADVAFCEKHVREGKHYRIVTDGEKKKVFMLDKDGKLPKVPMTSPWLQYLNYKLCGIRPVAQSRHACVCTPYIFNKYKGIFGLTASVGGKAELGYLTKTYKAVKLEVPRFLDTCVGDARKAVINHGVEVVDDHDQQIDRVVDMSRKFFRKVPVLVIASSLPELAELHRVFQKDSEIPAAQVLRFSQFDENGRSLKGEWQTIIDDAVKRVGSAENNWCHVTVTDSFGGRGHDFQVVDKHANANGGMLVIMTSIPDKREWIQWRGRTGRQDRPGQFLAVLNAQSKPFKDPKNANLRSMLQSLASEDAKVEMLLELADEGIGEKLSKFGEEQDRGEKLNELTELYYRRYPRAFEDPWPTEKYYATDTVLRRFLTKYVEKPPSEIAHLAKSELDIDLSQE